MHGVIWTPRLVLVVMFAVCGMGWTQEPERASSSAGEKTVTGCVAQGAHGFVLKTEDGRTLPLRGAAELSPFMGKKVQIDVSWQSRGVRLATPMESTEKPSAAAPSGKSPAQDFSGDVRLEFKGKVIGDCLTKRKK